MDLDDDPCLDCLGDFDLLLYRLLRYDPGDLFRSYLSREYDLFLEDSGVLYLYLELLEDGLYGDLSRLDLLFSDDPSRRLLFLSLLL